jgi:hypothetical protein
MSIESEQTSVKWSAVPGSWTRDPGTRAGGTLASETDLPTPPFQGVGLRTETASEAPSASRNWNWYGVGAGRVVRVLEGRAFPSVRESAALGDIIRQHYEASVSYTGAVFSFCHWLFFARGGLLAVALWWFATQPEPFLAVFHRPRERNAEEIDRRRAHARGKRCRRPRPSQIRIATSNGKVKHTRCIRRGAPSFRCIDRQSVPGTRDD